MLILQLVVHPATPCRLSSRFSWCPPYSLPYSVSWLLSELFLRCHFSPLINISEIKGKYGHRVTFLTEIRLPLNQMSAVNFDHIDRGILLYYQVFKFATSELFTLILLSWRCDLIHWDGGRTPWSVQSGNLMSHQDYNGAILT